MALVDFGGAINQIAEAVVILDIVQVTYLKAVRPRADEGKGNHGVDVASFACACPLKFHCRISGTGNRLHKNFARLGSRTTSVPPDVPMVGGTIVGVAGYLLPDF